MDQPSADSAESPAQALGRLALVSAELNAQVTLEDVTAAVLAAAVELNQASIAALAVLDGNGSVTVASVRRDDLAEATVEPTGSGPIPVHHSRPVAIDDLPTGVIASCIQSGNPSWRRDLSADSILGGVGQALGHPVLDETGGTVAVLALGWDTDIVFTPEVRAVSELFCDLTSSSLVRARRTEELADLAEQMRTALLPADVSHDRLDVASDYVPALNTIGFGGDWFDIVEPEPHRAVLVVGDIAGHGVQAAARMALVQGAVRALSQCSAIHQIPWLASRSLTADTEMLATLGLLDLDLSEMTVSCQLAGHPPPMLVRPDRSVLRLGGTPLPPIGMVDAADEPDRPVPLSPGCMLVMYSDGLIERRGADLSECLDALEATVASLATEASASDALETICTDMLTDESEDDVAILVVKLRDLAVS